MIKYLLASATTLLLSSSIYGQTINSKAGLWIVSTKLTVNGKKMPGILDMKGISEIEKQKIRIALKTLGVPADWNPALFCQKSDTIDMNDILRKTKAECANPKVNVNGSDITYTAQCIGEQGSGTVTGKVTILSRTESKGEMDVISNIQGKAIKMHHENISKWLGSDCNVLPMGIDPMWAQAIMAQK